MKMSAGRFRDVINFDFVVLGMVDYFSTNENYIAREGEQMQAGKRL